MNLRDAIADAYCNVWMVAEHPVNTRLDEGEFEELLERLNVRGEVILPERVGVELETAIAGEVGERIGG